jgi:hypothetical protein
MNKLKGLNVDVLKHQRDGKWSTSDCTNGGVTSKRNEFILVGGGIEGPFEVKEGEPYLELRSMGSGDRLYYYAVPVTGEDKSHMAGPMFGGNFVHTSDSRFSKVCLYPIPVHDRYEIWADHAILSM